eukprot:CAMPEP_0116880446 /NCGR_PEP_ID=MMETSP0463-20121206/12370_1 /TAXON_ID=181622 /ORGANISM="Strombidinopsis sp, Strain SopsisLIS2011" /LENGTH=40 /DNA_ID= /DNA_START= /DNA_END= /DNA_ORIENTATION=
MRYKKSVNDFGTDKELFDLDDDDDQELEEAKQEEEEKNDG